ncbi:hypothetical protein [Actinoplanes couchii]|uniref:Uncharacterized protein n=1 Tax=Actinoplanes couchii TaxID=403638 RepID=A0ABQ3WZW4_9ACTN|nr:hypothetical protein [Actinoplanes couchii]MDR6316204.1 hypothetical protein [Actinoplanes couchii]GID51820.1 hypothetical protein Aco03nite_002240 [Actinoplanes couchii]
MDEEPKSITEQAWELIALHGLTDDQQNARFQAANEVTVGIGEPNSVGNEAHVVDFSDLHKEIQRLWDEHRGMLPPK